MQRNHQPNNWIKMTQKHPSASLSTRFEALACWARQQCDHPITITPLQQQASHRQYYRVHQQEHTYILMDSPPQLEDPQRFISIAKTLQHHGLHVPTIFAADVKQGFLLISDFGDNLLHSIINTNNVDRLYKKCIDNLISLQKLSIVTKPQPAYDRALFELEINRFWQGYLPSVYQHPLSSTQHTLFDTTKKELIRRVLLQPQTNIHRDYHSKNLFLLDNNQIGMIDFQDICLGPIGFDAASLFYDHYCHWPFSQIQHWIERYAEQLVVSRFIKAEHQPQVVRWVNDVAIIRLLKNCGQFIMIDRKQNRYHYQQFLPNMFQYLLELCEQDPALHAFLQLLHTIKPEKIS